SRSQDDVAIYDYEWVFDPVDVVEDFPGNTINTTKWLVSTNVTQLNGITVVGAGSWGNRYIFSNDNFDRVDGKVFWARVRSNTASNDFAMWGFKDSGTTSFSYTDMPHAIYFNNGAINIYEDGNNRGQFGSYNRSVLYDIRITLKATGALYEYKLA